MPSKQVTDRKKSALAVASAGRTHTGDVSASLRALLSPYLKKGEDIPDIALLVELAARALDSAEATMSAADEANLRELADDDDTLSQVLWRTAWARILAESGKAEEAIAVVERAVEIAAEGDDIVLLGDAKSARGEVLWRAGRQEAAEPPLREALALYERKEDRASASRVRLRLEALAAGADPTAVG